MNKKILQIAFPAIVSNITVPLLSLVDVAIVGHLGSPVYLGAIAVGGMLFSFIYWIFVFLRMGTSGMTSQALGRRDLPETMHLLLRSQAVAVGVGVLLIALQVPITRLAFLFIHTTPDVQTWALRYFSICVWGAPAVLGLYGFAGWFVGMQNSRFPMWIAILQNVCNIVVSLLLVFGLGLKVEGVALGTVIAQYSGFGLAMLLWYGYYRRLWKYRQPHRCWQRDTLIRFFTLNRDIFLRTICLVLVTTSFTSVGAGLGEVVLAVNTLLMQFFTLFSYIMDGFAYSGEALSGLYIGAGNQTALRRMIRLLFGWGLVVALLFTSLYSLGSAAFLRLLTNEPAVIEASAIYLPWVWAIPACGFAAFLWDGILIGATATRIMLQAMLIASGSFALLYILLPGSWGNHALWMAFLCYLLLRGVASTLLGRRYFTAS
ncbi:MATE family efflux transporter [Parabacteroides distasonis]|nr:MATE family efflux transporter [Parabacteroides distasonis]